MSVQELNKQICRDYFKAFLARDTDWMAAHIAPDFVRHDPGLPFEVRGPEGVARLHDALMPAFPDMELPLLDFVAEGEKVLVRLRVQATHTGRCWTTWA
jgi:limonene-1,2-epoxide hydrolase